MCSLVSDRLTLLVRGIPRPVGISLLPNLQLWHSLLLTLTHTFQTLNVQKSYWSNVFCMLCFIPISVQVIFVPNLWSYCLFWHTWQGQAPAYSSHLALTPVTGVSGREERISCWMHNLSSVYSSVHLHHGRPEWSYFGATVTSCFACFSCSSGDYTPSPANHAFSKLKRCRRVHSFRDLFM